MDNLKQAWRLFLANGNLWWIVLLGSLSIVPLAFTIFFVFAGIYVAELGNGGEAIFLALVGGLFLLLFVFYNAFIQSMLIGIANALVKKKKISFMGMFKLMRPIHWRLIGYSLLIFLLAFPGIIAVSISSFFPVGSSASAIAIIIGFLWMVLISITFIWGMTYLPTTGSLKTVKKAWAEFTKKPLYTLTTFLWIVFIALLTNISLSGFEMFFHKNIVWAVFEYFVNFILIVYITLFIFSRRFSKRKKKQSARKSKSRSRPTKQKQS